MGMRNSPFILITKILESIMGCKINRDEMIKSCNKSLRHITAWTAWIWRWVEEEAKPYLLRLPDDDWTV